MLKGLVLAGLAAVVMLGVLGCSQTVAVVATATPMPTGAPDYGATVAAGVARTLEARGAAATETPGLRATGVSLPTATRRPTLAPTLRPAATPRFMPTPTPRPTATPRPTPTPTVPALASLHDTQNARWVRQRHPTLHRDIMALSWVRDGLNDVEKGAIDDILYAAVVDVSLARAVIRLPWVVDGMESEEAEAVEELYFVAHENASVARAVIRLPWVADGMEPVEVEAVEELYFVAHENASVARDLVGMPFVASIETADVHALNGIQEMIRDGFAARLTSSRVYRNGITDEWAPIVAAAGATGSGSAIAEYLNDTAITVETGEYITAGQPLAVTIVRLESSAGLAGTLGDVREAVSATESIMGLPLPTRHVIVVFDPRVVSSDVIGVNHGFAIGVETEDPEGGRARLRNVMYHEVAHYWWSGNVNWIDEGMADTIAATASLAQGDSLEAQPNRREDCITRNISDLGHTRQGEGQFHCNYYLGEMLFRALQDDMTAGQFTAAIRALYAASRAMPRPESQDEYRADIEQVRDAFPGQGGIIELHYAGDLNAPYQWDPDDAINYRHHDVVTWIQKPTYRDGVVSFSGSLIGEATLVSRSIDEAREGGIPTFTISIGTGYPGSILPELTDGRYWILEDPADVVADRFDIDGNSFNISFRWPAAAGDPIGKRITIWGFNNAGRMAVIGDRADALGMSLIR